jgi:hypothetical protein
MTANRDDYRCTISLKHISKYLQAHGIEDDPNMTMCSRQGWWMEYYRAAKKLPGVSITKLQNGFDEDTQVSLLISKRISTLCMPGESKKITSSACKSIW